MTRIKISSTIVSTVLVACMFVWLASAFAGTIRKKSGRVRIVQNTVKPDRLVMIESVPIGVPGGGATTHHSLASFRQTRAAVMEAARVRRVKDLREWRSTVVSPHPGAVGTAKILQEKIANAVSNQTFVPAQRLAHFDWCKSQELAVRGWKGVIRGLTQTHQEITVMIEMRPVLVSISANITDTPDYVIETYLYSNDELTFLACEEPPGLVLKSAIFGD